MELDDIGLVCWREQAVHAGSRWLAGWLHVARFSPCPQLELTCNSPYRKKKKKRRLTAALMQNAPAPSPRRNHRLPTHPPRALVDKACASMTH